eukprot:PhM_4_TR9229/c0_g1_i1/m.20771
MLARSSLRWAAMKRREDILLWATNNKAALRDTANLRWNETEGIVHYAGVAGNWIASKFQKKSEDAAGGDEVAKTEEQPKEAVAKANVSVEQYYTSQEVRNTFKWKRLTWDEEADYEGFAARLLENQPMFKEIPAFSHMSLHIVKDPMASSESTPIAATTDYRSITRGSLTSWALEEGGTFAAALVPPVEEEAAAAAATPTTTTPVKPTPVHRPAPFSVNWETAEVHIMDSASPQELLVFLRTTAPQLQVLQQQHSDEMDKLIEAVDNVRYRCSFTAVKYNENDRTAWDDPNAKTEGYINPAEMRMFCDGMLRTAWLFRKHFKGLQCRVGPVGSNYRINVEKREVVIPADFAKFNYVLDHTKYLRHESIANTYRDYWFMWLLFGCFIVGDLDII